VVSSATSHLDLTKSCLHIAFPERRLVGVRVPPGESG